MLVDAVREGGWAALGHLADGDMLLTIDGESVADVEAVQRKMARVAEARPGPSCSRSGADPHVLCRAGNRMAIGRGLTECLMRM